MTSVDVGKETERMVANWLRENGWPGAERRVRTAFHTADRQVADEGDLLGCPGICWQIKSLRPAVRAERETAKWLRETESQRIASRSALGFLVVRRWGTTDVGRWWAFQSALQLFMLLGGLPADPSDGIGRLIPVRMDMAALAGLLHTAGWAGFDTQEEVS